MGMRHKKKGFDVVFDVVVTDGDSHGVDTSCN